MALKDIIDTISKETKEEAERIKGEGNKKVSLIRKEGQAKIKTEEAKISERIDKEVKRVIDKAKFQSNIEERNRVVSAKQELINQVFKEALQSLGELNKSDYIDFVKKLIAKLPEVEGGEIVAVRGKEKLTKEALKEAKKKFSLSSETVAGVGGSIFRSKDLEVDNTFRTLVSSIRSDLEIEVSKILFVKSK
jgi:V/A-type H+-transporting ATPase subunit E